MLPSLPQNDPSPGARRAALARALRNWPLAHAYETEFRPTGNAVAATVPLQDHFSIPIELKVAKADALLLANHSVVDYEVLFGAAGREVSGKAQLKPTFGDFLGITRMIGARHQMFGQPFKSASRVARTFPPTVERYKETYQLLPKPPVIEKFDDRTQWNQLFAWYRLAGNNPFSLRGIRVIQRSDESNKEVIERAWPHMREVGFVDHDSPDDALQAIVGLLKEAGLELVSSAEASLDDKINAALGAIPLIGWLLKRGADSVELSIHDALGSLLSRENKDISDVLKRLAADLRAHSSPFESFIWALLSPSTLPAGPPAGLDTPELPDLPFVMPSRFKVTDELYQSVMGPDDSLEQAAAQGRLFMCDYRYCDALPYGTWDDGVESHRKYIFAPMALFAWRPQTDDEPGQLVPVAIQCHQRDVIIEGEDADTGKLIARSLAPTWPHCRPDPALIDAS